MIGYVTLAAAIIAEVVGSTMLKASQGFTKWLPALLVVLGYGFAFYFISMSLTYLPLNLVYATWAGLGTVLTVMVDYVFFKEWLNKQSLLGVALIVGGVFILNMSGVASHG